MGRWTVQAKIALAARISCTPFTSFLRRPSSLQHHICPERASQNLLIFSHFFNTQTKHNHAFLPVKPFSCLQRSSPSLLNSDASFSTALQPFDRMPPREHNLENTRFSDILDLIKFSSMNPNLVTVTIVHCLVLKVGLFARLPTSTSFLITYSRAGDFGSSMTVFSEIMYKDVIAWNAMMTACIENRYFGAALDFFVEMMERGNGFDSGTLVITISAFSNTKCLRQGQILHGLSVKAGMLSDSFLCNAIIDMYAKCSDLCSSENMFEAIQCRDPVSWNSVISGCLHNNSPQKSLQYFRKMATLKIHDDVSLSCAIAASTRLEELDFGQAIHGYGIKLGYLEGSHISVNNSLISLYSQCGHPEEAVRVFRGMVFKDVISWNSMIDGFASNRMFFEAFDLLHEMQLEGLVQPDNVTILTVLPLCAVLVLSREGRSVHAFVIKEDMASELSLVNSLMDFYLKCNYMNTAEYLFYTMPDRDLISWNTMISGNTENGHFREAQCLYKELVFLGSQCSLPTLLAILPSCCSRESLQFGKSIHCWEIKLGFSNDILAINALIFMYINCGDLKASLSLLLSFSTVADSSSWNSVISGCTHNSYFSEALEIFKLMKEYDAAHDIITLVNVISACGNLGLVFEGKLLHGLLCKSIEGTDVRVQNALITMYGRLGEIDSANSVFIFTRNRNLCSYNCIISALSQNEDGKRVLDMFRLLDIEPNEITISSVLSACTQLGLLRHGRQIHGYVFRFNFQRNPYISAALIDMYSNCGKLDIALQIFQNLPEKSVAAWNSLISAFGNHNNGQKTIEVLEEMIEYGTRPTKSTFINLLSACSHLGLVDEGQWYYDHMLDEFGVEPETEHRVCIVDMLGRSGRLGEAHEFIKKLPTQPEPGVWGALLSACSYYGDLEMGKKVAEILFSLEPENVGYYVSLFNMYAAAGRWDDAAELRRKIEDKGLKKPAGLSLIDVGCG